MNQQHLEILKPHYCNRNDLPSKIPKQKHQTILHSISNSRIAQPIINNKQEILRKDKQERIKQFKKLLFRLVEVANDNWEKELRDKQLWISKMKKDHRLKMQQSLKKLIELRKKIHQEVKHYCNNKKEGICRDCIKRDKQFRKEAAQLLLSEQENSEEMQTKEYEQNETHIAIGNTKRQTKAQRMSRGSRGSRCSKALQPQRNINYESIPENQIEDGSKQNAVYRYLGFSQKEDISSVFKTRNKQRLQASRSFNKNKSFARIDHSQNSEIQRSTVRNTTGYNYINKGHLTQIEHEKGYKTATFEDDFKRRTRKESRKSLLKLGAVAAQRNARNSGVIRSRFQQNNGFQKINFHDADGSDIQDEIDKKKSRFERQRGQKKKDSDNVNEQKKDLKDRNHKLKSSKFLKKIQDDDQLVALQDTDSARPESVESLLEIDSPINIRRLKQLATVSDVDTQKQQKTPKLSRYKRQKLFYNMLKKELSKNIFPYQFEEVQQNVPDHHPKVTLNGQMIIEEEQKEEEFNYKVKERKQSLITKLKIFNQTTNFQEIKGKIDHYLQRKDQFLLEFASKQILVSQTLIPQNQQQKNKILELFLGDVLKITDLKKLLKKKFSQEKSWGQKMRQMHQFYTYVQYSLQKFRANQAKNIQDNWREISFEGQEAEIDVEELVIQENMGHYEGLDNVGINEYEHHRQIQCSMKYYGLDVKRQHDTPEFFYNEPASGSKFKIQQIGQKSLKSIQQIAQQNDSMMDKNQALEFPLNA